MSNPNSADRPELPTELEREPAPDMLAELGPLAYGLFVLSEQGPLSGVRSLGDRQAGQVPAQAERTPERETRQNALLGEFGELDF